MITYLLVVVLVIASTTNARTDPKITAAFSINKIEYRQSFIERHAGHRSGRHLARNILSPPPLPSPSRWSRNRNHRSSGDDHFPSSATSLHYASPASPPILPIAASSLISPSNHWGNVAALSFVASLAQLLGRTTTAGKLLGAPVTAMALAFACSSVGFVPTLTTSSSSTTTWNWNTLLPPGGSDASAFLQGVSLTLATPSLLLGTSLRGDALRRCGALLGSFAVASFGTLAGAALAISLGAGRALTASLGGDGIKIAAALLAKNVGGGINYVAVCACLNASPESVAAGLCVDNVMALVYFPLVSVLASKYGDVRGDADFGEMEDDGSEAVANGGESDGSSPMESLSHAFTLAAVLTALGQFCNSKLHLLSKILGRNAGTTGAGPVNLSLPITTLLAVLFSTYYPPNTFLSPTSTSSSAGNACKIKTNGIAKAGETLGTSLLYLFFATAGAPGWRLKDSVRRSFPSIASFLMVLYGTHGAVLWGFKKLVDATGDAHNRGVDGGKSFWKESAVPQRLLAASSAAIGGPATAVALAKSFEWKSLSTPSLLVGNVGYAVATFLGLIFYGVFR